MPRIDFKRCSKCGEVKPVADFYVNRRNIDGYTNACKLCEQEKARSYQKRLGARPKSQIPRIKTKKCPKCGEVKPVSEFNRAVGKLSGYATVCRECGRISAASYRRNPSSYYSRLADREFADISLAGKKKCWMCGRTLPASDFNYSRSAADGLTSSCRECNREYKQRHYQYNYGEYYERYSRYRREHPDKRRAFTLVAEAIKRGELIRPEVCSQCGESGTVVAHHDDYGRPLDVTWLCIRCDRQLHADLRRKEKHSRKGRAGRD